MFDHVVNNRTEEMYTIGKKYPFAGPAVGAYAYRFRKRPGCEFIRACAVN